MGLGVLAPILSIGTELAGDYLAVDAARKAGQKDRAATMWANEREYQMAKEFAQNGIQWKIEDARKAGINPLAAIGATGQSYQGHVMPLSYGQEAEAKGRMYSNLGQNISRAIGSTMTAKQRMINEEEDNLRLKEIKYRSKVLDSQMTNIDKPNNPPMPDGMGRTSTGIPGQESPITIIPTGRTAASKGDPSKAFGSVTDWYFRKTPTGLKVAPSPDVQGILANNAVEMLRWEAKHKAQELLNPGIYRPDYNEFPLPKNKYWKWNFMDQEYQVADWPSNWDPKYRKYYTGQKMFKKPFWDK